MPGRAAESLVILWARACRWPDPSACVLLAAAVAATVGAGRRLRRRPSARPERARRRRARRSPTSATRSRSAWTRRRYIRPPEARIEAPVRGHRRHRRAPRHRPAPAPWSSTSTGSDGRRGGGPPPPAGGLRGVLGHRPRHQRRGQRRRRLGLRLQRADRPDDGGHRRRPGAVGRRQDAARSRGHYASENMRRFNTALAKAHARYPALRVFDWSDVAIDDWFAGDGIHYTRRRLRLPRRADRRRRRRRLPRRARACPRSEAQMPPAWRIVSIISRMPSDVQVHRVVGQAGLVGHRGPVGQHDLRMAG